MLTSLRTKLSLSVLLPTLAAALLLAALVVLPLPAQAHSVLLGTTPGDEEQLAAAPDEVTLTFNEDITDLGTEVIVTTGEGEVVSVDKVEINGPVISQALSDVRPAGAYTVTWRAVSADGHPISGVFTFTAADGVGEEAGETAPSQSTENDAPETGGEGTSEPTDEQPGQDEADDTTEGSGLSASTWVIIGVLIVAGAILITVLARSMGSAGRKE